jgi:nucleoside-diphosphate-sugar epimerase
MNPEAHGNFAGKRLVIFGCGYVGGEVARQALARDLRVTALTRNAEKAAGLRAAGIETVVADLASDAWHAAIPGGAEFVLNAVSSGGDGVEGYRRSYLEGMKSILAWARARGPAGTLVYTSSTSVYAQDGGVRVDESAPVAGRDERAAVLVETERLLLDGLPGEGGRPAARAFVLRLAGIYGPGRHHLIDQVRAGEVSGNGGHHLNLIHRGDICAAIWAGFGAPAAVDGGVFNVADDGAATKAEVAAWLAAQLGVPTPRFSGLPAAGRRGVVPDRIIVNDRLKAALGWRPRFPSFRDGYANLLSH